MPLSLARLSHLVAVLEYPSECIGGASSWHTPILGEEFNGLMSVFEVWVKNVQGQLAKLILEANGSMVIGVPTSFSGFLNQHQMRI